MRLETLQELEARIKTLERALDIRTRLYEHQKNVNVALGIPALIGGIFILIILRDLFL